MNNNQIGVSSFDKLLSLLDNKAHKEAWHFCKAHNLTFDSLTQAQQLTVLEASPYALFALSSLEDLSLNYKELTPELLNVFSLQEGLERMFVKDYDGEKLSENFAKLQHLKSFNMASSYDQSCWKFLNLVAGEFNWDPIVEMKNLNYLRLINVGLSYIDSRINNLTELRHLSLNNNYITELPESIFELPFLWVLELSDNEMNPIDRGAIEEQVTLANQKRAGRKLILSMDIRTT